ncbi:MAG: hypothetical protein C4340_07260, partial [Armatimonadota bacterium]
MAESTAVMAEGRSTDPPAPWYGLEQQEVLSRLEASADGLSTEQARRRLERHGPNRLNTEEREPLLAKIGEALLEPLQLLLIAVGVLSAVFGELRDAIAIFAIIAAVAGIEIVTELRARRALTALRALAAPRARVHRDG